MSDFGVVTATRLMAEAMAPKLRQADRDEIAAASGMDPQAALLLAVERSQRSDAIVIDGEAVAMAGVMDFPLDPQIGVVWMLATDAADRVPKRLLQEKREYVLALLNGYDMLLNFVDNRNTRAQKWLQWLGFTLEAPEPHGVAGLPFRRFWMRKANAGAPRQDAIERDDDVRLIV